MSLNGFFESTFPRDKQTVKIENSLLINFQNTKGEVFSIDPDVIIEFIESFYKDFNGFRNAWEKTPSRTKSHIALYDEKAYRSLFRYADESFGLKVIHSIGRSQTKPLTMVISKVI